MYEENKAIAKKFLAALFEGDVTSLKEASARDILVITPGTAEVCGSRDYHVLLATAAIFPSITKSGLKIKFLDITAEDDRVACEAEGESEMLDGKSYNNTYHFLVFIRDGKVCKVKEYTDTKLADEVLGPYLPAKTA